jgi:hypothetical protein
VLTVTEIGLADAALSTTEKVTLPTPSTAVRLPGRILTVIGTAVGGLVGGTGVDGGGLVDVGITVCEAVGWLVNVGAGIELGNTVLVAVDVMLGAGVLVEVGISVAISVGVSSSLDDATWVASRGPMSKGRISTRVSRGPLAAALCSAWMVSINAGSTGANCSPASKGAYSAPRRERMSAIALGTINPFRAR